MAEARKGLDLVVLDQDRRVLHSEGRLSVYDTAQRLLGNLRPDVVCIDGPPAWSAFGGSRAAERALRALGITAFATGQDPGPHPFYEWMREGFSLYAAIAARYPLYRGGAVTGTAAEVFPEASAVLLTGRLRDADEPKRLFRSEVLRHAGVDCGVLPTQDRVDAALAALTGLVALEGGHSTVGDPTEGVIVLPVAALPEAPLRRGPHPGGAPRPPASTPARPPAGSCGCGCGAEVRRRFLPGHNTRLRAGARAGARG